MLFRTISSRPPRGASPPEWGVEGFVGSGEGVYRERKSDLSGE